MPKNLSATYYQESKERYKKRYKILPENEKQRLAEYRKKYYRINKKCLIILRNCYCKK